MLMPTYTRPRQVLDEVGNGIFAELDFETEAEHINRFRELYGIDNELPVLRTEFGNIAVSSVQLDPLVFSSLAMKGAEIILRTSTLYFPSDVAFTALLSDG